MSSLNDFTGVAYNCNCRLVLVLPGYLFPSLPRVIQPYTDHAIYTCRYIHVTLGQILGKQLIIGHKVNTWGQKTHVLKNTN